MSIGKLALLYLSTLVIFAAIDMTWLGVITKNLYQSQLGYIMSPTVVWWAIVLFYLLFILGLLYFAVLPAVALGRRSKAIAGGALFGLFTYMTYDLVNYALIRDWPLFITVIDMLWGVVLCSAVSAISFSIARRLI